ncbi:MAG: NAD+ synthase [Proteobacteria bacterium]|nr:NAD+ synthase [Pseudomonadota bacterium]
MPAPVAGLRLAVAQLNPTVGDLAGNARQIEQAAREAYAQGAQLVVAPELVLSGYPPEDLLLRPAFMQAVQAALEGLASDLADCAGLHLLLGLPTAGVAPGAAASRSVSQPWAFNSAALLVDGRLQGLYHKRELPNYQVFDERRYFHSGRDAQAPALVFPVGALRVGVLICEDAWFDEPAEAARAAGAELLCVLNASPYHMGKAADREARMAARAQAVGLPLVYAHLVGGQDEMVFDGGSFAVDAAGAITARAPAFEPALLMLDAAPEQGSWRVAGTVAAPLASEAEVWAALVLGVRDYVGKNGFPGALIGLSGGVDSALVLAVAVDALGADKVRAVMMPSRYTADISWLDARDMVARLAVRYDEIAIEPMFQAFLAALAPQFQGLAEDATEENIQARVRGTLLMALSNKTGAIVLTTGNKSEMATGYCTLYGDMAGGFAVIKDVAKTLVYRLCRWRNAQVGGPVIPERILTRPPSAELRPDQTDQDSLPPYEVLDAILARYMENNQSVEEIVAAGFAHADVARVVRLIGINEYKRRQAPVGIRITHRAFGRDWRYPITSRFRA